MRVETWAGLARDLCLAIVIVGFAFTHFSIEHTVLIVFGISILLLTFDVYRFREDFLRSKKGSLEGEK